MRASRKLYMTLGQWAMKQGLVFRDIPAFKAYCDQTGNPYLTSENVKGEIRRKVAAGDLIKQKEA